VSAFLAGVLIFALGRICSNGRSRDQYPCRLCPDIVHWNGQHWVHSDGEQRANDVPFARLRILDPTSPIMRHPAIPAGYMGL
jgi:hypothetical protein